MNTYTVKILVFLLSLFILITVTSQLYLHFNEEYKTETAVDYVASERIAFEGVYIRNETVVTIPAGSGAVSYPLPDGSKVAPGSVVAEIYSDGDSIDVNRRLERLKSEIDLLKQVQSPGTTAMAQPEFLSKLVDQQYMKIVDGIESGDLSELDSESDELLKLMSILNLVVKKEDNYDGRIASLQASYDELLLRKTEPYNKVTVEESGYFVGYTDGYEDELDYETVLTLTPDEIKQIIQNGNEAAQGTSGKLFDGYDWKMTGIVDNSDRIFTEGSTIGLKLSSVPEMIDVRVEKVRETDKPDESIIILDCDKLTTDLVRRRVEHAELVMTDFTGIKVPRKAINFNANNDKGVFVKLGNEIYFKKLDVIYEQESYVISKKTADKSYLQLYDDIVVEGVSAAEAAVTDIAVTEAETVQEENVTDIRNGDETSLQ